MRAAGLSVYKILSYAMLPALLVAGGGVLVGEYVLPDAERMARLERRQATSTQMPCAGIRDLVERW